jgi:hypothetical protein
MASFEIVSPKHGTFLVQVDDGDLERVLASGPWNVSCRRTNKYVARSRWVNGRCATERLHNFLLNVRGVDHINGDGLDNRRENLRRATAAENGQNRRPNRSNTSGIRGVSFVKKTGRWHARLHINGRDRHLGYFEKRDDADTAVRMARAEMMPFSAEARVRGQVAS